MALDCFDLRSLAEMRLRDAAVLIEQGQYDAAYYLAGYAVECALKAVIAKRTRAHEFPDLAMVRRIYTHDLQTLLKEADLGGEIGRELAANEGLSDSWNRVILWTEASRYDTGRKPDEAETLYNAISDPSHGVLSCLSKHW